MPDPPWHDTDLIPTYTRAHALAAGALIAISPLATEAGFCYAVVVTVAVWQLLEPSDDLARLGHSAKGRAWEVLQVLRAALRRSDQTDRISCAPLLVLDAAHLTPQPVQLWALCGPGDDEAPVIMVLCDRQE